MTAWAPMFAILLRVPRRDMLDLSVPAMVDHVDYYMEMNQEAETDG